MSAEVIVEAIAQELASRGPTSLVASAKPAGRLAPGMKAIRCKWCLDHAAVSKRASLDICQPCRQVLSAVVMAAARTPKPLNGLGSLLFASATGIVR